MDLEVKNRRGIVTLYLAAQIHLSFNCSPADGPRIKNTSYLYYEVTCGHVICVSTGSPATRVSWMKNGVPLITDGSTYYSLTQIVTNRASSTYYNVLAVNGAVAGIYTCTVSNDMGFESREIPVLNTGELPNHSMIFIIAMWLKNGEINLYL